MSANIFGERFMSVRKPAWHGLGTVLDKAIKPTAAVKKFGLDYEVSVEPMVVIADGRPIETGKMAIMRHPTNDDKVWRSFGVVGDQYEVLQNSQIAEVVNPLAEVWGLETVGALDFGKTMFMTLKTGPQDVEGDEIQGYFLIVECKDGGSAFKCVYTPVRVVCQNTLKTGLRAGEVSINLHHLAGIKDQLAARIGLIAKAQNAMDATVEVFRQLAQAKIKPEQADLGFEAVYPLPRLHSDAALVDYSKEDLGDLLFKGVAEHMYDYNFYVKRQQDLQAGAQSLYEKLNDEYPQLAGTAWHFYNAVVESADFRDGGKTPEVSALFGARGREKAKAFTIARSFIK